MLRTLPLALLALLLAACSSVETQKSGIPLSRIQAERFQVLVRTGYPFMDKLVYELAFQQFGSLIPLKEKEPFSGSLEITFTSSAQSASIGSSTTAGGATAQSSGWYTGTGYVGGSASAVGSATTVSSGGTFTWQNSTMLIVLKKTDGDRLWTADYSYKGGWELSGFVVNTPEEAARLVLKRLKERFDSDFTSR